MNQNHVGDDKDAHVPEMLGPDRNGECKTKECACLLGFDEVSTIEKVCC